MHRRRCVGVGVTCEHACATHISVSTRTRSCHLKCSLFPSVIIGVVNVLGFHHVLIVLSQNAVLIREELGGSEAYL